MEWIGSTNYTELAETLTSWNHRLDKAFWGFIESVTDQIRDVLQKEKLLLVYQADGPNVLSNIYIVLALIYVRILTVTKHRLLYLDYLRSAYSSITNIKHSLYINITN